MKAFFDKKYKDKKEEKEGKLRSLKSEKKTWQFINKKRRKCKQKNNKISKEE